jgi:hypothetical protein
MPVRDLTDGEMAKLAAKVGGDLVKHFGEKKHYSMAMVNSSARRQSILPDCLSWAYSLFTSAPEFEEIHARGGEDCDYAAMRSRMKRAVSIYTSTPSFREEDPASSDMMLATFPFILTMFD